MCEYYGKYQLIIDGSLALNKKEKSLGRDLNPRPRPYQGRAIPLSHQGTDAQRASPKYHSRDIKVSSESRNQWDFSPNCWKICEFVLNKLEINCLKKAVLFQFYRLICHFLRFPVITSSAHL